MSIASVLAYAKDNDVPISAVVCSPCLDSKKGRVSKGTALPHKDWNKKQRWELKNTKVCCDGSKPIAWFMDLRKANMFVIDIDVKNGKTAKDILIDEAYDAFTKDCNYIIETGSKGLHFYYTRRDDKVIDQQIKSSELKSMMIKEEEYDNGDIDIITNIVITEGSKYIYNNVSYDYISIKNSIDRTNVCSDILWGLLTKSIENEESTEVKNELSFDEIIEHIDNIPNNTTNWETWYRMGQLIYNTCGQKGKELFFKWSRLNNAHNESTTEKQWRTYRTKSGGFTVGTLLYLSKNANEDNYKKIRSKYFVEKPMDKVVVDDNVLIDDKFASEHFIKLMMNKIVKQNGNVYLYDEKTGMWQTGDDSLRAIIMSHSKYLVFNQKASDGKDKVYNYGGVVKNINNMITSIPCLLDDKSGIINESNSKACLLFQNGWFNMKTKEFHEGFEGCRDFYFTKRITRAFPTERNKELEESIYKKLFVNPYNNKDIGKYYCNKIARAIAGHAEDKNWITIVGKPNCGKGVMTTALLNAFEQYVGTFNMNSLKFSPQNSNDEAKKLAWYVSLIGCRVVIGNEVRMDKISLDGNLIKTLSGGGDIIKVRGQYQNEFATEIVSTFFGFSNDLPKISPCDQGLKNRIKPIPHTKTFVSKPQAECTEFEMEADNMLKENLKTVEWMNAFMWIIFDNYGDSMAPPIEVVEELDDLITVEEHEIKPLLQERYEFTSTDSNDYVTARELIDYLQGEMKLNMSENNIGRELRQIGLRKDVAKVNKKTTKVYYGLKVIPSN